MQEGSGFSILAPFATSQVVNPPALNRDFYMLTEKPRIGTVVTLDGYEDDGPWLVIFGNISTEGAPNSVTCGWFNKNNELQTAAFPKVALTEVAGYEQETPDA